MPPYISGALLCLFCALVPCATLEPLRTPSELGQYLIENFEIEEDARHQLLLQKYNNFSFRVSTTPFVTSAGFRDLCFPYVIDNNGIDACALPLNPASFFGAVPDGSCIYMSSQCFYQVMKLQLLRFIPVPRRFTLVTHFSDRAVPDPDPRHRFIDPAMAPTSPALQNLVDEGRLLAFHGLNLHWSQWSRSVSPVPRPAWLHCLPLGMNLRFWQSSARLQSLIDALRRNVLGHPGRWRDPTRPLLLVPVVARRYAKDRARALKELGANVKSKKLEMTRRTYVEQSDYFDAVARHRFTVVPWGNGLDTHRMYEVLALGGVPVVRRSSITSCYDGSDNYLDVPVVGRGGVLRGDRVERGDVPVVVVRHWKEVTTEQLEEQWATLFGSTGRAYGTNGTKSTSTSTSAYNSSKWDYRRLTLGHWQERILGRGYQTRSKPAQFLEYQADRRVIP